MAGLRGRDLGAGSTPRGSADAAAGGRSGGAAGCPGGGRGNARGDRRLGLRVAGAGRGADGILIPRATLLAAHHMTTVAARCVTVLASALLLLACRQTHT